VCRTDFQPAAGFFLDTPSATAHTVVRKSVSWTHGFLSFLHPIRPKSRCRLEKRTPKPRRPFGRRRWSSRTAKRRVLSLTLQCNPQTRATCEPLTPRCCPGVFTPADKDSAGSKRVGRIRGPQRWQRRGGGYAPAKRHPGAAAESPRTDWMTAGLLTQENDHDYP
jgi:hypothetical protein